ncbi:MAG: segregation and condensation protein A [Nocardioidaceae bacterium]
MTSDIGAVEVDQPPAAFAVHLDNFEGPFDLLLQLISKHKLDITEVALSKVTDEFIAHTKALGTEWELEQTTGFLVVAATLLDLKIVRLLPAAEIEDEEDLALLEARDLLFARLMQYRAFKQVATLLAERMDAESTRVPRSVGLDERFAQALPDVLITLGRDEFAALAARALEPKEEPSFGLTHLHAPQVSVRDQATMIVDRLRSARSTTFRALTADSPDTLTTVARFLALLELFREGAVAFEQVTPLGELGIRWTGSDEGEIEVGDEYDEHATTAEPAGEPPAESVTDLDIAMMGKGEPVRVAAPPTPTAEPEEDPS